MRNRTGGATFRTRFRVVIPAGCSGGLRVRRQESILGAARKPALHAVAVDPGKAGRPRMLIVTVNRGGRP